VVEETHTHRICHTGQTCITMTSLVAISYYDIQPWNLVAVFVSVIILSTALEIGSSISIIWSRAF